MKSMIYIAVFCFMTLCIFFAALLYCLVLEEMKNCLFEEEKNKTNK
jgi:hypothetical protein